MGGKRRPKLSAETYRKVFDKKAGRCHHCDAQLVFGSRKAGMIGAWHADHFPVPYRDIENQVCFGVTRPDDLSNLVPACAACNLSHRHESRKWCGRAQLPCLRPWWTAAGGVAAGTVLFILGVYVQKYLRPA